MPEKKGFDFEALKELIKIMKDNDISEVCLEQNGMKMQVKQGSAQPIHAVYSVPVSTVQEKPVSTHEPEVPKDNTIFIYAPTVGTFYQSPSPDAEPYVKVGTEVKEGQVICIIEAMKFMNEITADIDCEIIDILVKEGQSVEYEQPIFRVKPKR